ncbi:hypothetical protein ACLB2K_003802 [Fragaria x ananassa]
MRELIRKQHKSWTSKEEEALAAGVQKHGAGNWKTILKYSKFARYLAQKSSSDLWKKWETMTFRVSDEKLKPLSPKVKKIVASNLELEGINDRQSSAFDDHDQEEKVERILEMEEDKEDGKGKNDMDDVQNYANAEEEEVKETERVSIMAEKEETSMMDAQSSADPSEAVKETERIMKMKEFEDAKSMLLEGEQKGFGMAEEEETSMMDAQSSADPSEAVKETERIMKMKEFEDAKSMLLLANLIMERFSPQNTNLVSDSVATAFSQAVKESKRASEMAEGIDRFSTTSPPQAEKETEVTSRMKEDTKQVPAPAPAPAPPQAVSETVEDTRSMLLLLSESCERFLL